MSVVAASHSPYCYLPAEAWNEGRARRALREDVPFDSPEVNASKAERIRRGYTALKEHLARSEPDVVVIFGDDQLECFDFSNTPAFGVYVGDSFEGVRPSGTAHEIPERNAKGEAPRIAESLVTERVHMRGHPALAVDILTGLMRRGFDPAFLMDMPKPEKGIGHAVMRPSASLTDLDLPTVPILLNCYYAPQVTARRCVALGRAVRQVLDSFADDVRVAVIGSGGLWHTPGAPSAYLDEGFDRATLADLERGDVEGLAERFEAYHVAEDDASQQRYLGARTKRITGLPSPGGPQGGTRETCNWIAAAATVDGCKATVVDYVPVYASPVGVGFAYWEVN